MGKILIGTGNEPTSANMKLVGQEIGYAAYDSAVIPYANHNGDLIDHIYYGDTKLYERDYAKIVIEWDSGIHNYSLQISGYTAQYLYGSMAVYVPRGSTITSAGYIGGSPNSNYKITISLYGLNKTATIILVPASYKYVKSIGTSLPAVINDDIRMQVETDDSSNIPEGTYHTITFTKGENIGSIVDNTTNAAVSSLAVLENSTITVSGNLMTITSPGGMSQQTIKAVAKTTDAYNTYAFNSWGSYTTPVVADQTITPTGTATLRYYTVSFVAGTNATLAENYPTITVAAGTPVTHIDDTTIEINGNRYTGTLASNPDTDLCYASNYGWMVGNAILSNTTATLQATYVYRDIAFLFTGVVNTYVVDAISEGQTDQLVYNLQSCRFDSTMMTQDNKLIIYKKAYLAGQTDHTYEIGIRSVNSSTYTSFLEYSLDLGATWTSMSWDVRNPIRISHLFNLPNDTESVDIWIRHQTS